MPKTTSVQQRLDQALARIGDAAGEGSRTCLTLYSDRARAAAEASDARKRQGISLGPLDGAIVTIKDLFDGGVAIRLRPARKCSPKACPLRRMRRGRNACGRKAPWSSAGPT